MSRICKTLSIFIILVFVFSCEEQGYFISCSDCFEDEPVNTSIDINIDILGNNGTLINVYEGKLEDNILLKSFTARENNTSVNALTLNKKYTITATYFISNSYYIAVESAIPRVKYNKDKCENPCYSVYDRVVDLKLKYTK
jgi:hypothetical protein